MLALEYARALSQCTNATQIFATHVRFAQKGHIQRTRRDPPRGFTVFFTDTSFVKKVFNNNQSTIRVYE